MLLMCRCILGSTLFLKQENLSLPRMLRAKPPATPPLPTSAPRHTWKLRAEGRWAPGAELQVPECTAPSAQAQRGPPAAGQTACGDPGPAPELGLGQAAGADPAAPRAARALG